MMKLNKRQFNKKIGNAFQSMMPDASPKNVYPEKIQKRKSYRLLNAAAITLFLALYSSLLIGKYPAAPYDTENMRIENWIDKFSDIYN